MASRPKIGQYRHTPSGLIPGPDGKPRPARMRRRFPYLGIVFLVYGMFGPLVCAGVSLLFRATGATQLLPRHLNQAAVPPAPSLANVLFGAGFYEMVLACGLIGFWLWGMLWKMRVPKPQQERGVSGVLPALLGPALLLGPVLAFAALPIGVFGLYLRTAPANQPWPVRPFFALLAAPVMMFSSMLTGVIPLVLIALGLLMGVVTAVAVAVLWQSFPEEAALK